MNKNIICDIDGCIAQYDFPALLKKYFEVTITNQELLVYSIEDFLGVPKKQVDNMFAAESFVAPVLAIGALEVLRKLVAKDYNVCIYSKRLKFMEKRELELWLDNHGVPYSCVLNGEGLPSHAVAAIDDSPSKLLEIASKVFVPKLLLFAQPWNSLCMNIYRSFTKVNNWADIEKELKL